jgi:hypothetical protein
MRLAKARRQPSYFITRQTRSLADIDLPACHGTGINDPTVTLIDMLVIVRVRIKGLHSTIARIRLALLAREFAYGMVLGLLGRCEGPAILFIPARGCKCSRLYKDSLFLVKSMLYASCHCFDLAMDQDLCLQLYLRGTVEEVCLNIVEVLYMCLLLIERNAT